MCVVLFKIQFGMRMNLVAHVNEFGCDSIYFINRRRLFRVHHDNRSPSYP